MYRIGFYSDSRHFFAYVLHVSGRVQYLEVDRFRFHGYLVRVHFFQVRVVVTDELFGHESHQQRQKTWLLYMHLYIRSRKRITNQFHTAIAIQYTPVFPNRQSTVPKMVFNFHIKKKKCTRSRSTVDYRGGLQIIITVAQTKYL